MLDLIIAECSDCHLVRLADLFEYFKLPTARLGVPADWTKGISFEYYYEGLLEIAERLEICTGIKISDATLMKAVDLMNRIRKGLWQISELRRKHPPPISGYDFIRLNHSSFYCDPEYQIEQLRSIYEQLLMNGSPFTQRAPRILLAGRLVAVGDYVLSRLVETSGGVVVTEFLDEGHRHSGFEVDTKGDLLRNIAETYYLKRTPPSVFQPAWKMRVDSLKNQVLEYDIDGVIWYQLSFEEIYDMECSIIRRELEAMQVPFLKLESSFEYSREAMGPLTTRVESFIESIKTKRGS
jgi:benzoyl-CoA reductase/2-hydroxyglutaryl-CoA dehydratase subunit BcrC/BadD/HgdB